MHETTVRVRFCETDALGHVNNTSYFIYLEEARVQFFEEIGYGMKTDDWTFILASTKCDFIDQAYFNQELTISTEVSKIGNKSFHLAHSIVDKLTDEVIARGEAILVYYQFDLNKSIPIPTELRDTLEKHYSFL
ncbi:acyl-CoA thioesterase [Bacillus weihaiensis]|uniref:Thioesterase n=1 Tax=Bacillus weihaiensis TaxID=1547283 RepID=A0A1L3MXL9_9BACI|nr:thioesterase family protein [Bacillus weihaiensis]APH07089.1 thioesterase [Bacillus weihaiensis]